MKKLVYFVAIAVVSLLCFAGSDSKENITAPYTDSINLVIRFKPVAGTAALNFDSTYTNSWKEKYSVSLFRFYVSHLVLVNTDSNGIHPAGNNACFLIDAADSSTWQVQLAVPPARYNRISFLLGVDSIHNVSGAQSGALDPLNGMFWTWNSGYVMAKLVGQSAVSSLVNNNMEYHIGGFKGPSNVLRYPVLPFPGGQYITFTTGRKTTITITADTNAWFYGSHELRIANTPSCTTPGPMAAAIADNYSTMFTVTTITN